MVCALGGLTGGGWVLSVLIFPWVFVGIVGAWALLAIIVGLIENSIWNPERAKTPQEARAAGRRAVQNILIPGFSGVTLGVSILLGVLFPDARSGLDDKQMAGFIVLFVLAVVVQGLVAWLSSADEPPVEVFYSSPERILGGVRDIDPVSLNAPRELKRLRECRAEWNRSHGKKVFFVGYSKNCWRLNESLSWVPANPRLPMREAADVKNLIRVIWASWRTGVFAWFSAAILLLVLFVLGFSTWIIVDLSVHLLLWWIVSVIMAVVLWSGMELVLAMKSIRWFSRQKSFEVLLDAELVSLDNQIDEAQLARRLEHDRIDHQLDRMEQAIARMERRLARPRLARAAVSIIEAVRRRSI